MNDPRSKRTLSRAIAAALFASAFNAAAVVNVQCPCDNNGDADCTDAGETQPPGMVCMHLTAGDSFALMSDDQELYTFGFGDRTGVAPAQAIAGGILSSEWPGPTIELDEGDQFYLALTNVGTVMRPDLFDPHTVHFHGFPNAASVFDGVPETSIAINMGNTLTYYYNIVEPGTFLYHCHVEATEHMEMGMLANLFVHPAQDATGCETQPGCPIAQRKGGDASAPMGYVYNDDDGTTAWDVEAALQLSSFDFDFHDAHINVQPLPFAELLGDYPQLNGRGYPDTIRGDSDMDIPPSTDVVTQTLGSRIEVTAGDRLLLRLSNVGLDRFWTIKAQGMTMKIVGTGARQMRGIDGKNIYREVSSWNFGGGESLDAIIDTAGLTPGTYFIHATELHQMSNRTQLTGGMITEIVVN
jgi:FtsP/CotA-like multicopper oxidase with cupredoxin domain